MGAGGLISKAGGKNPIGRLDRHAVEGSLEWRTRGFFCGQLLSFNTTRQIIPGWCVELWKSGREAPARYTSGPSSRVRGDAAFSSTSHHSHPPLLRHIATLHFSPGPLHSWRHLRASAWVWRGAAGEGRGGAGPTLLDLAAAAATRLTCWGKRLEGWETANVFGITLSSRSCSN